MQMEVGDKKLLVLHLKGFLIDCYHVKGDRPRLRPSARVNLFSVYKRPGCDEFLKFCFEKFIVGVWSSAHEHNASSLVKYTFGNDENKLAFLWSLNEGTASGKKHPDNKYKPLVWKELSKLWNGEQALPWKKGTFGPSNTVLVEDDPYAIQNNPPNTAIILENYRVTDPEDNCLVKLRRYLERLADAENVQEFLAENKFGKKIGDDLALRFSTAVSLKDRKNILYPEPERTASGSSRSTPNPLLEILNSALSKSEGGGEKKDMEAARSEMASTAHSRDKPQPSAPSKSESAGEKKGELSGSEMQSTRERLVKLQCPALSKLESGREKKQEEAAPSEIQSAEPRANLDISGSAQSTKDTTKENAQPRGKSQPSDSESAKNATRETPESTTVQLDARSEER